MTALADFQDAIAPAIPQIVAFLDSGDPDVRAIGIDSFAKLSKHAGAVPVLDDSHKPLGIETSGELSPLSAVSDEFPFVASPTPPTGSISWGQVFVNEPELAITSPHIVEECSPLIDESSVNEQASHVMADKRSFSNFYTCLSCILSTSISFSMLRLSRLSEYFSLSLATSAILFSALMSAADSTFTLSRSIPFCFVTS
ncbi:hypothetical protein GALMADRAFT_775812 [Galerina marginata CBS 339.88]|uniref:Uncharacterized protein n=1 Tax=Galerina marginata (strain CBS 339.88) TaxID=685588 RepID=A0A067SVG6_GALM3|nr:hypothetical protein GALMADRAFT_775812 [Galerina marginata CBS 339.88]